MDRCKNISLKSYNSFGIDVRAAELVEYATVGDLEKIFVEIAGSRSWMVLGGGNNILFTRDYEGVLLHPVAQGIEALGDDGHHVYVRAEAGVEWDDLVEWCVARGLWGAENLSLIPGYVGAAPVQNIGAYGTEAGDIIESVEMYCADTGNVLTLAREYCGFGYRESIFKRSLRGRVVITAVNFVLDREPSVNICYGELGDRVESLGGPSLRNIRDAVMAIRRSKLPDPRETGNAGSFFKNPVVSAQKAAELRRDNPSMPLYPCDEGAKLAAGWLIDKAGWKGFRRGDAGVHERQALVLVNYGGATGEEILALAGEVRDDVKAKFGVEIEMEVNVL